jgi:Na+/melibiose symporter-like transporter
LDTFQTGYNRESLFQTTIYTTQGMVTSIITYIPTVIYFFSGLGIVYTYSDDDIIDKHYSFDEKTLWLLRIFLSFVPSLFAILAYFLMRSYPLRKRVADKINETFSKEYQITNATDDITLNDNTNNITNNDGYDLKEKLLIESTSKIDDDFDKTMIYFHFSREELNLISNSICSTNVNEGLQKITYYNIIGLIMGLITTITLIAASIIQIMNYSTSWISILLTLLLVISFYLLYEILRFFTIRKIKEMDALELRNQVQSTLEKDNKLKYIFNEKLSNLLQDYNIENIIEQLYQNIYPIIKGNMKKYLLVYGMLISILGVAVYGLLY